MKNTRLLLAVGLAAACVALSQKVALAQYQPLPQVTTSPILNKTIAVLGPDESSPDWPAWASNIVWQIYLTGHPASVAGVWPVPESSLTPYDVSQPTPGYTNTNICFVNEVWSINPAFTFSPADLVFVEKSSDQYDALGTTNTFRGFNYVYSPWCVGISWAPGGPGVSDTILDDASAGFIDDSQVNQLIFIGAQTKAFTYANSAQWSAITNYMNPHVTTNGPGFSITGSWYLASTNVDTTSYVTLQTQGNTRAPLLTVQSHLDSSVTVGINMETNRTALLEFRSPLTVGWTDIATVNASDPIVVLPVTSGGFPWAEGYFQAVIDPTNDTKLGNSL